MFFFLYTILNVLKHLESVHRTFQCFPYKHANENMHENKHKNLKYQQVPVLNSVIWGLGSSVLFPKKWILKIKQKMAVSLCASLQCIMPD